MGSSREGFCAKELPAGARSGWQFFFNAAVLLLAADGVMLVVGLIACAVPLRRALAIDPTEALRAEG